MTTQPFLSYERLDVYHAAIAVLAATHDVTLKLPRGYGPLADQLRRAATSVPLNIAEATGRSTGADQARHYAIARGSALECGAILDALRVLNAVEPAAAEGIRTQLISVVRMLCRLSERASERL